MKSESEISQGYVVLIRAQTVLLLIQEVRTTKELTRKKHLLFDKRCLSCCLLYTSFYCYGYLHVATQKVLAEIRGLKSLSLAAWTCGDFLHSITTTVSITVLSTSPKDESTGKLRNPVPLHSGQPNQSRISLPYLKIRKLAWQDLNLRHRAFSSPALPTELQASLQLKKASGTMTDITAEDASGWGCLIFLPSNQTQGL